MLSGSHQQSSRLPFISLSFIQGLITSQEHASQLQLAGIQAPLSKSIYIGMLTLRGNALQMPLAVKKATLFGPDLQGGVRSAESYVFFGAAQRLSIALCFM